MRSEGNVHMSEQSRKAAATGTPASRMDAQKALLKEEAARTITGTVTEQEGAEACNRVENQMNQQEAYRRVTLKLIQKIDSLEYLRRICKLVEYLYMKK